MEPAKCDWDTLQKRKKKKKKRKRCLSKAQVLLQKQTTHCEDMLLGTTPLTKLNTNTFDRELELNLHVGFLRDRTYFQRTRILKQKSFSVYRSKQALVKSLLEKYLKNRRMKPIKNGSSISPGLCLSGESEQLVECFLCKTFIEPSSNVVLCSYKGCKRNYHFTCAKGSKDFIYRKNGDLVCPQHICMTCKTHQSKSKVLRCDRCIVAAHTKCLAFPEHVTFLTFKPGCIICWHHPQDWRMENKETFKRLPIPYAPIEFSIQSRLQEISENELEPAPFVYTRRNIFLVKRRKDDVDGGIGCNCKGPCQDGCICRAQSMSCSKSCSCEDKCRNKPFRKDKKIKIVKTLNCGWGIQTSEPIAKGEFIVEYVGEVINEAICEERLWTMKAKGDHNFYMCEIGKNFIIDATFKGNASRFVNHSCHPNCILEKWRVDKEIRVGIFAIRDIKHGEALTYDYKFVQFGGSVKCFCGASNCRGYLGETYQNKKIKPVLDTYFKLPTWGERHKRTMKQPLIATS